MSAKFYDLVTAMKSGFDVSESAETAQSSVDSRAARIPINLKQLAQSPVIGGGKEGNAHLY